MTACIHATMLCIIIMNLKIKYITSFFFFIVLFTGFAHAQKEKKSARKQSEKPNKSPGQEELQQSENYFIDGMKYCMLELYAKALQKFEKAHELNPENAAINYKIADLLAEDNKYFNALPYAKNAVSLNDQNKYYYELLAEIYERQLNFNEATKVYQKLLKKVPGTELYLFDLANVYSQQGKYDDVIKTYNKIEILHGINEDISKKKQQIYLKHNELNKAIEVGEELINAYPEVTIYKLELAELLISNDKFDEAITLLEKVLSLNPDNPLPRLRLSDIYKAKNNSVELFNQLEIVFQNPKLNIDAKVGILLSYIRLLSNNNIQEKVLRLGKTTTEVHPDEAKAFAVYGDLLAICNIKDKAVESYLKAISMDNSHYKIWEQLIILESELNEVDSIIAHSAQALELFPNQAMLWHYNGMGYLLKNDHSNAVKSFEQGKKMSANNTELLSMFNSQLGDAYNGLKKYEKSDAAFEEVLKYDSNNSHALNNYSYFLSLRSEKLNIARKHAEKLTIRFPQNPTFLDTYGWVLYKQQQYDEAKKVLERAVTYTKKGIIIEHYGDVLFKLGEKDLAVQQWKKPKNQVIPLIS